MKTKLLAVCGFLAAVAGLAVVHASQVTTPAPPEQPAYITAEPAFDIGTEAVPQEGLAVIKPQESTVAFDADTHAAAGTVYAVAAKELKAALIFNSSGAQVAHRAIAASDPPATVAFGFADDTRHDFASEVDVGRHGAKIVLKN